MENVLSYPLFVVGLPRSGTKLLRALLHNHSRLFLAIYETHFLPFWARTWQRYGDLSRFDNFENFYRKTIRLPYFLYVARDHKLITADHWYRTCPDYSLAGVFEALIRHDTSAPPNQPIIWGEKTPAYIQHIGLLKSLFPEAKIIHIIRDVRDCVLSAQNAWGKNPYRAAQRWSDAIIAARETAQAFSPDYKEVRYEDLVTEPTKELTKICRFLGVEYEPGMLKLSRPTESHEPGINLAKIIQNNTKKYETDMPTHVRHRIEAIAGNTARHLGYEIPASTISRPLPPIVMRAYEIEDGMQMIRSHLKQNGLGFGIGFIWGALLQRGRSG